jgi:hypothetical protein
VTKFPLWFEELFVVAFEELFVVGCRVQALADMSEVERKVALERYKLLEPHLQNGRELRSVSEGSGVSFRTLQRWVSGYKREGLVGWSGRAA